jgi:predicted phosphoribosyltransferase
MASDRPVEIASLRDQLRVFRDRQHAGLVLADMLHAYRGSQAVILAIPAGGVPVAAGVASAIGLPLQVAVVSKVPLPWNAEVGYGAVAFDGSVRLNDRLTAALQLTRTQIDSGIAATRAKVQRRVASLCRGQATPDVAGRPAILVDDGVASGFTMLLAVEALRHAGARAVDIAVPTASTRALKPLCSEADTVFCANVRSGPSFAVADAYERWRDVPEESLVPLLASIAAPPRR